MRRVRHLVGMPAEWDSPGEPVELGWPTVVLLEEEVPGSDAWLYRFDCNGAEVGDTWHRCIAHAKEQAAYEYGEALDSWQEVPVQVTNAMDYAASLAKKVKTEPDR